MRLYVLAEGQTEMEFIKQVLAPHLADRGVWAVPVTVTTRRDKRAGTQYRGGGSWVHRERDLRMLLRQHGGPDVRFTTIFDLYRIPADSPGFSEHKTVLDTVRRAELFEQAMEREVADRRFIPYLQRHEFEALVLASLDALHDLLDPSERAELEKLRASLGATAPEDTNDGEATAPSKRLEGSIKGYKKRTHGPDAIKATGLAKVRAACPRFDGWLKRLEALGPP